MGLEAGIWASRLRYRPGGWGEGGYEEEEEGEEGGGGEEEGETQEKKTKKKEKKKKKKEKEEEEKIPHMCESIGHRPLRGRCPKRRKTTNMGAK